MSGFWARYLLVYGPKHQTYTVASIPPLTGSVFSAEILNLVWHSAYSPTPPAEGGRAGEGAGRGRGKGQGEGQADNSNTSDSYISQIKAQSPSCCLYR